MAFSPLRTCRPRVWERRELAISPIASSPLKTTIHELAHILLHAADDLAADSAELPRNLREVEAEATALLVFDALGFDTTDSRGYIQHCRPPRAQRLRRAFPLSPGEGEQLARRRTGPRDRHDDAVGQLLVTILAGVAQFELDMIRSRTKEALQALKRNGKQLGRPGVPPHLRARILLEREAGATLAEIATALNNDNVPTAMGGAAWYPSTIGAILRKEGTK